MSSLSLCSFLDVFFWEKKITKSWCSVKTIFPKPAGCTWNFKNYTHKIVCIQVAIVRPRILLNGAFTSGHTFRISDTGIAVVFPLRQYLEARPVGHECCVQRALGVAGWAVPARGCRRWGWAAPAGSGGCLQAGSSWGRSCVSRSWAVTLLCSTPNSGNS